MVLIVLILIFLYKYNFRKYTEKEFLEMPAQELYELFKRNGLKIPEKIHERFTKEQFIVFFKDSFIYYREGMARHNSPEYKELALETEKIYEKLLKRDVSD